MTISIANRILLGFAVIVALMVGLGIYAINQLDDVRQIDGDDRHARPRSDAPARGRRRAAEHHARTARGNPVPLPPALPRPAAGGRRGPASAHGSSRPRQREASLAQAIATANGFAAHSVTSQRADAWRRIIESAEQGRQRAAPIARRPASGSSQPFRTTISPRCCHPERPERAAANAWSRNSRTIPQHPQRSDRHRAAAGRRGLRAEPDLDHPRPGRRRAPERPDHLCPALVHHQARSTPSWASSSGSGAESSAARWP